MTKLAKTNVPGFVKDIDSGLVINKGGDFERFKVKRKQVKKVTETQKELDKTRREFSEMKSEFKELKDLLKQLLERS